MLCLTIIIKSNDSLNGKRLHNLLIEFLMEDKIAGAIISWVLTVLANDRDQR